MEDEHIHTCLKLCRESYMDGLFGKFYHSAHNSEVHDTMFCLRSVLHASVPNVREHVNIVADCVYV